MPAPPALGALGLTFTTVRGMQLVSLTTIIGIAANFISELVTADYTAPPALVGTLVVAALASLYTVITYILYWDSMLPFLITAGADGALLIAVIVVACVVGRPVSYLSCQSFPKDGSTADFINSLFDNVKHSDSNSFEWVNPDQASCFEIKAVWGLSIAMCILFAFSAITSICLWRRIKGVSATGPKDLE